MKVQLIYVLFSEARIYWGGMAARIIMWDLGASNGVVHIIDNILSDHSDLNRDISASSQLTPSAMVIVSVSLLVAHLLTLLRL